MAQDHGLCKKRVKVSTNGPVHGPPLQARVAAANGTVLAACKLLALTNGDPGAHGMNRGKRSKMNWTGAKQNLNGANERGQELRRAVGMAGKG